MNKSLLVLFVFSFFYAYAQEIDIEERLAKHEIHFNVLMPIAAKSFEVSYERILNEDTSVGISGFVGNHEYLDLQYMVSPYFRKYFSKSYASGFFMDVFLGVNQSKYEKWGYYNDTGDWVENYGEKYVTDAAFGVGAGAKFLTSDHFVGMIYGGIARNLFANIPEEYYYSSEIVGKGGIYIGYRF
jgi:hypothetical protein